MYRFMGILDAPTLNEIFESPYNIAEELKNIVPKYFYDDFIDIHSPTDLQADLQARFDKNKKEIDTKHNEFYILVNNLFRVYGNDKIVGHEIDFKNNFLTKLANDLPIYLAYFKGFTLDNFKDKDKFNKQGTTTFGGSQNTDNTFDDLKNFDKFTHRNFTPEELLIQSKNNSLQLEQFIWEYKYMFNGVKYDI